MHVLTRRMTSVMRRAFFGETPADAKRIAARREACGPFVVRRDARGRRLFSPRGQQPSGRAGLAPIDDAMTQ
jgi:hypothetical protein